MTYPIHDKALASHIAILGKTGSGKTWAAKGLVERVLDDNGRACVIDPTGVWYGLRTSATGKSGGYPVAIFGGEHADFPLAGTHGEALAEIIATSSTPAVIDTSLMKVGERTRFFADFGDAIVRRNKGPLHLVVDEAHLFAPQGRVNDPQSGAMLHAANNMVSLGRSRGLRIVLISQRPAKLHKDSLTQVETLVAMRLIAPQDRRAVEDWIKDNADPEKGREIMTSLATLKTGQAWLWAPELQLLERVTFPRIRTLDTGAAPDGAAAAERVLAPIDREAITARLGAIAKEADANDPKKLRARIAELERALAAEKAEWSIDPAVLEKTRAEGFAEGHKLGWKLCADTIRPHLVGLVDQNDAFLDKLEAVVKIASDVPAQPPRSIPDRSRLKPGNNPVKTPSTATYVARKSDLSRTSGNGAGDRQPVQQRILDALAELEQIGAAAPSRELVAFMAGYSNVTSKGFANAIGALRTGGMISYPTQGEISLTAEGRAAANPPERPRTAAELQERVIALLGGASSRILKPLIEAYPGSIEREQLGELAGYGNVTSKGFANALGRLRSLGFVDYPDRGHVAARPVLFLE